MAQWLIVSTFIVLSCLLSPWFNPCTWHFFFHILSKHLWHSHGLQWIPVDSTGLHWTPVHSGGEIIVIKVHMDTTWTPLHSTPLQSNIVWVDLAVERVQWGPVESIWNMGGTDKTSPIPPRYILSCSDFGSAEWLATIINALSCSALRANFLTVSLINFWSAADLPWMIFANMICQWF